ncbi:MAG: permease [Paenibacillaceae bacterium]|jgi:predicted permease|nr:permease [Paenibacillaceae bacterium]
MQLQAILTTMFQVILPISLPVLGGVLLRLYQKLETKPLLTLYLYVLSPSLIFNTLTKAELSFGDVYQTVAFSLLNLLVLWALAKVLAKLLRLEAPEAAGLTLISTFTNSVNYGLPLVLLAFGQLGLDKASIYVISQMVIVNTIGVYFAARSQFSVKDAIRSVFKLPAIYAAALAFIVRWAGLALPSGLDAGIVMLANAYSPIALSILGAQMVNVGHQGTAVQGTNRTFWTGLAVRMLLSPLAAFLVLLVLRIEGTLFSVLMILASMPVAVNAVVLAERFDASPRTVSRCILWTTLGSFIILPVWIVAVR